MASSVLPSSFAPKVSSTPRSARAQAASLQFFGASEDKPTISPWFHPEDLNAPNFDPASYVSELRQYAPLESLSEELRGYLATLKAKLVEVINEDYNDFVSLSTKLVNVDTSVLRMQKPLQQVGSRLTEVQANLQNELSALQSGLQKRQEIATARALLELMQNSAHTMSKVESLLQEIEHDESTNDYSDPQNADNWCRTLERLASEISRLNFYTAKGEDLPFIQQMKPQMLEATEKLQFRLAAALKQALIQNDDSSRQHCLLAYGYINDSHGAEKVVRDVKARPIISAIIDSHSAGPMRSADSFPQIMQGIGDKTEEILGPLLSASSGLESSSQLFCFPGNSLLAEVDEALNDRLSGALSPGVPDSFALNYTAGMAFLERLETFCTTPASFKAFRNCSSFSSFTKKWKLSIYFSTRFQEIAGSLETSISAGGPLMIDQNEKETLDLQLNPSLALVKCMQRAISKGVFLPSLTDKFLKLLLQLMARYKCWLKVGTRHADHSPPENPTNDQEVRHGWREGASLDLLASAQSDLDYLNKFLEEFLSDSLSQFAKTQTGDAIKEAFREGIDNLVSETQNLVGSIVSELSEKVSANLNQLRGITAMYRMSARPPPSRPSHYVHGMLTALKEFFDLPNSQPLTETAKSKISEATFCNLCSRFGTKASELLDTLRKTESSLNRIKKNRTNEQIAPGGMTDIEKISMQLFLDVQELGRQAKKFNVDASNLTEYQELWKIVAPAEKADSIILS